MEPFVSLILFYYRWRWTRESLADFLKLLARLNKLIGRIVQEQVVNKIENLTILALKSVIREIMIFTFFVGHRFEPADVTVIIIALLYRHSLQNT